MKRAFRTINFRPDTLRRIEMANEIVSEYDGQKLTARQVYYQFVARDLLPNTARSYKNLTTMLTDARYAGLLDWDAIEDRGREPDEPPEWSSIDRIVDAAVEQYRSPRHRDQPKRVELWVEKQALAGVLAPIARRWHVTLMVNKGYSSASTMKEAADRMLDDGKERTVVLYLGDHDPSGEDMVRDVRDRLEEFGVLGLLVDKVALTMDQIRQFDPLPNPAKVTDSRAAAYVAQHGGESWELDALPPRELNRIVEQAITRHVDRERLAAAVAREEVDRARVRDAIARSRRAPARRPRAKPRKRR